jgi:O-antigen/teichoic acid export membrane protein
MLKKILGTILSKGLTAICNFLVVILTANYLGAEGRGEIAIIILGLTIVNLFQSIIGGPALVYLTPRYHFFTLQFFSYLWALLISFVVSIALVYFDLYPQEYFYDLIALSFIQGILSTHQFLLLGKEKIKEQNILEVLKSASSVLSLLMFFLIVKDVSIEAFIKSTYIAFSIPLVLSIIYVFKFIDGVKFQDAKKLTRDFFKYGFSIQLNNISQMFNYRFCFYLLEKFYGNAVVGIFSVAVSIAEAIWVICRSIATVQYARIANSHDKKYKVDLTVAFSKVSLMATVCVVPVMLLLPSSVYSFFFGSDFEYIKPILVSLSGGVIFMSFLIIINHYYSGNGKYYINTIGSLIGNVVILVLGFILIPRYASV